MERAVPNIHRWHLLGSRGVLVATRMPSSGGWNRSYSILFVVLPAAGFFEASPPPVANYGTNFPALVFVVLLLYQLVLPAVIPILSSSCWYCYYRCSYSSSSAGGGDAGEQKAVHCLTIVGGAWSQESSSCWYGNKLWWNSTPKTMTKADVLLVVALDELLLHRRRLRCLHQVVEEEASAFLLVDHQRVKRATKWIVRSGRIQDHALSPLDDGSRRRPAPRYFLRFEDHHFLLLTCDCPLSSFFLVKEILGLASAIHGGGHHLVASSSFDSENDKFRIAASTVVVARRDFGVWHLLGGL